HLLRCSSFSDGLNEDTPLLSIVQLDPQSTNYRYDEKTQSRVGKKRVIGRVAGQMTEAIYALLKRDAELLAKILPGQDPTPAMVYDPEVHQRHRQGHYRPLKSTPLPNTITVLHPLPSE